MAIVVLRPEVLRDARVSGAALDEAILRARDELGRGEQQFGVAQPSELHGRSSS
jgi:hypothetical protein